MSLGWWQRLRSRSTPNRAERLERAATLLKVGAGEQTGQGEPTADQERVPTIAEILAAPSESPLKNRQVADVVEEHIAEARSRGEFDKVAGKGQPLRWLAEEAEDQDWLVNHVMSEAKILPPWIELDQQIRQDLQWLREHPGHPTRAQRIEQLNRKIDDFNLMAPSLTLQRPRYRE